MKLNCVRVQTFRSIVDSGMVVIEEGVTVLIGKNEQGKSNFLRALESFNENKRYTPHDLPNHLRPSLEQKSPREVPIVTLTFSLDPEDMKLFTTTPDRASTSVESVKCVKCYDNSYTFSLIDSAGAERPLSFQRPDIKVLVMPIQEAASRLKELLLAHIERLPAFAAQKEQFLRIVGSFMTTDYSESPEVLEGVKVLGASLKALPAQDTAIQQDISAATKELDSLAQEVAGRLPTDQGHVFRKQIPVFILHNTKGDSIPDEVDIAEFTATPEKTSPGMLNLCRTASLSIQRLRQLASTTDAAEREAYEDYHQGIVSGGLNEYWTQGEYQAHFRISDGKLRVSISDDTYSPRIAPSDRSEGFQWYLSFYCSLLNVGDASRKTVLLLDNPGLELHVDGQKDIKRFLEDKMAFDSQIIYVTHSPAMIDSFNLTQLRKVSLLSNNEGTRIQPLITGGADYFDLLEPARSAIGTNLAASIMLNDFNILVEGAADKPVLDGAFLLLHQKDCGKMVVNGSIAESKDCLLARFYSRARLPFVVLLDSDDGGRKLRDELRKWTIDEQHIVMLNEVFPDLKNDFAIEDIVSDDDYWNSYNNAYPANPIARPPQAAKKTANRYEEAFRASHKLGFNKKRVGESLKAAIRKGSVDAATRGSLEKLTAALLTKLSAQSQPPSSGAGIQPSQSAAPAATETAK